MENTIEGLKLVRRPAVPRAESVSETEQAGVRMARLERRAVIADALSRKEFFPLWDKQILEINCDGGEMLQAMMDLGALEENLFGVERIPRRVADLRRRFPEAHLFCESIERLDFHDARFDLVVCSGVFSTMADSEQAVRLAGEIRRVLQPGGAVVWYDARFPRPGKKHVRAVTRSGIHRLFHGWDVALRTCTLLPPLARRLGRFTERLYPLLAAIRPLRSHYAGLIVSR